MKIKDNIYFLLLILFSIITTAMVVLYFLRFVGIDIVMLFLGLTNICSGLNQINMKQPIGLKGINRANKGIGIFTMILGLTITMVVIIKII